MTCIVGLVDNRKIYMGGDSSGVANWEMIIRKDRKVFRNGDFLIGGTSSFRMLQLLQYALKPPTFDYGMVHDLEENGEVLSLEGFMATTFIDAIRQCFKDGGYAKKNSEEESGGTFLVGFRGRLFQIDSDYQVGEWADGYAAIGSGAQVALGSLYTTVISDLDNVDSLPRRRVALALEAAEHHNIGVRGPFYVEVLEGS